MNKEELEKLKDQTKLELLYGFPLIKSGIDTKGMHEMTIQTVCNPKVLLKVLEHSEKLEAALACAESALEVYRDAHEINLAHLGYDGHEQYQSSAHSALNEISKIKG
jgi:hypothetical protein